MDDEVDGRSKGESSCLHHTAKRANAIKVSINQMLYVKV
jgi:hypothetical protein